MVQGLGIDLDRPTVVFVGRITRQKGLIHLVRAAQQFDPETQVVLLAGAPDTPEIAAEFDGAFAELQAKRSAPVIWVPEILPRASVRQVMTHATVFACWVKWPCQRSEQANGWMWRCPLQSCKATIR